MIAKVCVFQVMLALTSGVLSTELLPERYLKPQDFNHHPFTDVGIPASLKKALKPTNLYAILSKKRPREGREFPPQNLIIYPTPHPSVTPRNYLETNEIGKYVDPYSNAPKNYAFSYIVKDRHSGDDFSHSQAHNGKATRGQYRVKLPDGRIQIVNYTADHKGYRADVQYEEDSIEKNTQQVYQPLHSSQVHQKPSPQLVYTVTATPQYVASSTAASPVQYVASSTAASPVQYVAEQTPLNLVLKPSATPLPYQPQYVSTTAAPYVEQRLLTSTAAPHYIPQQHLSSTALYSVAPNQNAVYQPPQYQTYHQVDSSTVSPEHAVIVTPRPTYIRKNEPQKPLYYRLL